MSKHSASCALAVGALILGSVNAAAADICPQGSRAEPVSGTIMNNFASDTSTLGVINMVYGKRGIKLICALSGQQAQGSGDINFIHSISCNDTADGRAYDRSGKVPVHSSIVLYTTGTTSAPQLPTQLFTFTEFSTPITDAPARGVFAGVKGGQIVVEGAVYKGTDAPYGSIDMTFKGEVCY